MEKARRWVDRSDLSGVSIQRNARNVRKKVREVCAVAFIALRPLRHLRHLRCARCVRSVGWKPHFTHRRAHLYRCNAWNGIDASIKSIGYGCDDAWSLERQFPNMCRIYTIATVGDREISVLNHRLEYISVSFFNIHI